jgi:hypothetical protein
MAGIEFNGSPGWMAFHFSRDGTDRREGEIEGWSLGEEGKGIPEVLESIADALMAGKVHDQSDEEEPGY